MLLPDPNQRSAESGKDSKSARDAQAGLEQAQFLPIAKRGAAFQHLVKELARLEKGERRDLAHVTALLGALAADDRPHLENVVLDFFHRLEVLPPERVAQLYLYGLYNCVLRLKDLGQTEGAEYLLEQLLLHATRAKEEQLSALLHSELGVAYDSFQGTPASCAGWVDEAEKHFQAAYEYYRTGSQSCSLAALVVYQYFARRALQAEELRYEEPEAKAELQHWLSRIDGVIRHPDNRLAPNAADFRLLAALDFLATVKVTLEEYGLVSMEQTLQAFELTATYAQHNPNPVFLSRALTRLAEAQYRRGLLNEALSESVQSLKVAEKSGGVAGKEAQSQAAQLIHLVAALLEDGF